MRRTDNVSFKVIGFSLVVAIASPLMIPQALKAEAKPNPPGTLQPALGYKSAISYYRWVRAKDREVLYSSTIAVKVFKNQMSLFRTCKSDPLGSLARCGALGCDLGIGDPIGVVQFQYDGARFVVANATGSTKFLRGATCEVTSSVYGGVLSCASSNTPSTITMQSVYEFAPGD